MFADVMIVGITVLTCRIAHLWEWEEIGHEWQMVFAQCWRIVFVALAWGMAAAACATLLFRTDDVVDLVNDAIRCDYITFGYTGVLDFRSTIAAQSQINVVDGFHQAHKWPFRWYDSSTT